MVASLAAIRTKLGDSFPEGLPDTVVALPVIAGDRTLLFSAAFGIQDQDQNRGSEPDEEEPSVIWSLWCYEYPDGRPEESEGSERSVASAAKELGGLEEALRVVVFPQKTVNFRVEFEIDGKQATCIAFEDSTCSYQELQPAHPMSRLAKSACQDSVSYKLKDAASGIKWLHIRRNIDKLTYNVRATASGVLRLDKTGWPRFPETVYESIEATIFSPISEEQK